MIFGSIFSVREVLVTLALTPTRIGIPRIWRANGDFRDTAASFRLATPPMKTGQDVLLLRCSGC